jgi:hypothetical protein
VVTRGNYPLAVAGVRKTARLMHAAADRLGPVLATVRAFAAGAGAERVVVLLDAGSGGEAILVELTDRGTITVTAGGEARRADPQGAAALPLPPLRAVPASALTADPETGEIAAPVGAIGLLADSVLALARACGGRSVATATFPTRDPAMPLTLAAREGEDTVLDVGGRHFLLPT